eukprot:2902473-Rhodomonas_salina.2
MQISDAHAASRGHRHNGNGRKPPRDFGASASVAREGAAVLFPRRAQGHQLPALISGVVLCCAGMRRRETALALGAAGMKTQR